MESLGRDVRNASRRDVLMQILRIDPDNHRAHNELSWLFSTGPAKLRDSALAVVHARQDITCVECHGESEAHTSDEDNTTPPQVLYPREGIAKKCSACHRVHDATAVAVITRWQERGLQKNDPQTLVCTDCHGDHRLRVRTIHWDKKTGKLLPAGNRTGK